MPITRRAALLAAALAFALPADAAERGIMALLAHLPTAAFDHTTEGLEAPEYAVLLARGESEYWTLRRVSPRKVVFAAKHPFSEVHVTLTRLGGRPGVQAKTFNEKVERVDYWRSPADGKPLEFWRR